MEQLWQGSLLVTIVLVFVCAFWARALRRRQGDPARTVRVSGYRGDTVTLVEPPVAPVPAQVLLGSVALTSFLAALAALPGAPGGAVVLAGFGIYTGLPVWWFRSGRMQSGTLRLTRETLTQNLGGIEYTVRWDDITGFEPGWDGVDLDVAGRYRRRRRVPFIWVGRGQPLRRPRLSLSLVSLHPALHSSIVDAIMDWASGAADRAEIGTEASRARLLEPSSNLAYERDFATDTGNVHVEVTMPTDLYPARLIEEEVAKAAKVGKRAGWVRFAMVALPIAVVWFLVMIDPTRRSLVLGDGANQDAVVQAVTDQGRCHRKHEDDGRSVVYELSWATGSGQLKRCTDHPAVVGDQLEVWVPSDGSELTQGEPGKDRLYLFVVAPLLAYVAIDVLVPRLNRVGRWIWR